MVNLIDNTLLQAFYTNPGLVKTLSISYSGGTLGMSDISLESLELDESLSNERVLTFGTCETSELRLRIKEQSTNLLGKELTLTMTVTGYDPIQLGKYTVDSYSLDNTRSYRDIVAHDSMTKVLNTDVASWYNGLTFPMTLKAFRDSFFTHLGISQVSKTLINDSLSIEKTIEPTELSGKQVINCICELNGALGHINREGKFVYVVLNDNTTPVNVLKSYYEQNTVICQDFVTDNISKVQIRAEEGDIGAIVGDGSNCYIIENNFLVYGFTATQLTSVASTIYNCIRYITYRPFNASKVIGNPCIEVGDRVSIKGTKMNVDTYVLSRSLSGIQALFDEFSANGLQVYPEQVNSLNKQVQALRGKTNVLERTVEKNSLTITDLSSDVDTLTETTSSLTQTSNNIEARLTTAEKRLDQEVETYEVTYEPTLYNVPAIDWTTNIPVDGTVAVTDSLHFEYTSQDYQNHLGYIAYGVETNTMYRFAKNSEDNSFYWKPVVNSDMSYVMNKVSELEMTVDGIETNVAATYETKSAAESTKTQLESQITQSATSITTQVASTYQRQDGMNNYATVTKVSEVEQTADKISFLVKSGDSASTFELTDRTAELVANYINLKGLVQFSGLSSSVSHDIVKGNNEVYYLASSQNTGVTTSTSGWTLTTQTTTNDKKYLWQYTKYYFADNTSATTSPIIVGVYGDKGATGAKGDKGDKGDNGTNGTNGTDGISVSNVVPLYYQSNSTTTPSAPTSRVTGNGGNKTFTWGTVPAQIRKAYPYFYTCDQVEFSNGTTAWTTVHVDRALSNMGLWCAESDTTLIDGGKIYTGSVTANQLAANSVTAEKISVSDLSALNATIGGFSIGNKQLIEATEVSGKTYQAVIRSVDYWGSVDVNTHAFEVAVNDNGWKDKFYVTYAGSMVATDAYITGSLIGCSMTGGSASFGDNNVIMNDGGLWCGKNGDSYNCRIDNAGAVSCKTISMGGNNLVVNNDGVYLNSNMNVAGAIGFANNSGLLNSSGVKVIGGNNYSQLNTNGWLCLGNSSNGNEVTMNEERIIVWKGGRIYFNKTWEAILGG